MTNRWPDPKTRRTTQTLALLGLLLAASVVRADEGGPPAAPAHTLVAKAPTFEAGKVDQGTKLRHVFHVKNVGKTPLSIDAKPG